MTPTDVFFYQYMSRHRNYPRVIDLVQAIRRNGGISNEVRYRNGNHQYNNLVTHIEHTYGVNHRVAMDAAKYFMR